MPNSGEFDQTNPDCQRPNVAIDVGARADSRETTESRRRARPILMLGFSGCRSFRPDSARCAVGPLARFRTPRRQLLGTLGCAILLLSPLQVPAFGIPPDEPKLLTLERAVALALESNRTLRQAELEVAKQDDGLAAARTRRLPSIELSVFGSMLLQRIDFRFTQGAFGTFPSGTPNPATDVNISTPRTFNPFVFATVNQPVTQLHRINLGIRVKETGRELAKEDLRARKQSVANEMKAAFFSILKTQTALEAMQESIKLYRELDRVTGDYVLQQVALKSQSLEVKTRLAQAELDALKLQNALASQKEQLNRLIGRPITSTFRLGPVLEAGLFEADLSAAQARALEQRPELREARLKQKQAALDRRMKKAEFIPDLSLSYRYISPFSIEVLPKNISAAGVYLSWEPFDWGRKRRELAEKARTEQQAGHAAEDAEALILLDVNHRFRTLQEARASLRVAQLGQETGREKLRVVSNRYAEKAVLLDQVLQAQAELAEAQHRYSQSLADFWTAKAGLEKAIGEEL